MNYIAKEMETTGEEEGFVIDVGSLYAEFGTLEDHRDPRGKRYELALILTLIVLAKLAGEDQPTGFEQWAQERKEYLIPVLGVRRERLPSHNTYRRALGENVECEELQIATTNFLTQKGEVAQSALVCLDGKTLRGTIPTGETQGVHLLAAYLPEEGIVLMQVAVERHQNEISAAPKVLNGLDLKGKIVTGDALLTQRDLSIQIVEAGGEYVWLVKDNHPRLRRDIELLFQDLVGGHDFQTVHQVNKGHGRLEERTLTTSGLLNNYLDWPGLEQVFQLKRRTTILNRNLVREHVVYGLTSLAPPQATPKQLMKIIRSYWRIENGLHYRRDKTLHEDATRMNNSTQAEALAILNNLIIALSFRLGFRYLPQARRHFNAHLDRAILLVLGPAP
jgi:predicted transposase YbfD/YdcC